MIEIPEARAQRVTVSRDALTIDLVDGRTNIAPLMWCPRLGHGTAEERRHIELLADGTILHWPDLDEDLSVAGVLAGRRSGESPSSLKRWLDTRRKRTRSVKRKAA